MRGRLIFPFLIEIAQLDTDAMLNDDPDGDLGPATSGYDDDFNEPVNVYRTEDDGSLDTDDTTGTVVRVEKCFTVPAQIHPDAFNQMQQLFTGTNPNAEFECWLHFKDLEELGLVDEQTGLPLLQNTDRLVAIYDCDQQLIQEIVNPPGLYATQVQPRGFSFGRSRNLLVVTFTEREQGTRLLT